MNPAQFTKIPTTKIQQFIKIILVTMVTNNSRVVGYVIQIHEVKGEKHRNLDR
jgi:hypothetical protein